MKWLVVLLALFFAPGFVLGEDWKFSSLTRGSTKDRPEMALPSISQFIAFANREVMNVKMDVRVFVDKDAVLDERTKGHCLLSVGGKSIGNMRDYIIYGINGPEIWFPYLQMGEEVEVFIIWHLESPKLFFATTVIGNNEKKDDSAWERGKYHGRSLWSIPKSEHLAPYRELSLDDFCETFTSEAVRPVETLIKDLKIRH